MKGKVVILGGGESGIGAAILAKKQGFDVFLSDLKIISANNKKTLLAHHVLYEEGFHTIEEILLADEIIKSPGIPDDAPVVKAAIEANIPVISEIEFAMRHSKGKFIGITGTNGKTTTTLLTYHLLHENGLDVGLAGNVGHSLARQVAENDRAYYVVELSSFQLDGMFKSKLHIAVLLNITPDHLDRYQNDFQLYVRSKFRILRNMRKDDHFIYNIGDSAITSELSNINTKTNRVAVSLSRTDGSVAYQSGKYLMFRNGETTRRIGKSQLPLLGKHNMINMMCAVEVAMKMKISFENIISALRTFENAPHRMEFIGSINNVDFYNDSKATNVDAVRYALESFEVPIVLILGGKDKGNDYSQLDDLVKERVTALVALGADTSKIEAHFADQFEDVASTDSVFTAVEIAYARAPENAVVLLSPACASFDLFANYEERGSRFKEAFYALKDKIESNLMMML